MDDKNDCPNPNCACNGPCGCGNTCTCIKAKEGAATGCDNEYCKCSKCGCGKGCVCNVPGIED